MRNRRIQDAQRKWNEIMGFQEIIEKKDYEAGRAALQNLLKSQGAVKLSLVK